MPEYYASEAEVILPYLADRPINVQRFPDGIDGGSMQLWSTTHSVAMLRIP